MRRTQPSSKRPKFLQQPMSNCYNGYMVNNNNKRTILSLFHLRKYFIFHFCIKINNTAPHKEERNNKYYLLVSGLYFNCKCFEITVVFSYKIIDIVIYYRFFLYVFLSVCSFLCKIVNMLPNPKSKNQKVRTRKKTRGFIWNIF